MIELAASSVLIWILAISLMLLRKAGVPGGIERRLILDLAPGLLEAK
jgi:hypothetical protein